MTCYRRAGRWWFRPGLGTRHNNTVPQSDPLGYFPNRLAFGRSLSEGLKGPLDCGWDMLPGLSLLPQ